jgi:hypothetical protein
MYLYITDTIIIGDNMKNKKRNRIFLLLILLLGISIGFAALATTLKINGNASITKNTWSVYWDEDSIAVTQGGKGDTTPEVENGEDGSVNTKVTWSVNLELPGDFYEFTIDAANAGTIDAMITGITPTLPQDLPSYVSYSVTYADGVEPAQYHLLPKGTKSGSTITPTTEKYKVRIEFLNTITPEQMDAIPEEGLSLDFGYEVQYGQADDNAIDMHSWILPDDKTASTLAVGDELCYRGECFNFIKYDNDDIVMLAKYNLNVGPNAKGTETFRQDVDVRGEHLDMTTYGTVPFSTTYYWDGNVSSYPADIYDSENYAEAPGTNNYSVAYYVEAYKNILTRMGAQISDARLLTYSEATDSSIGCGDMGCPMGIDRSREFIRNTTFWLGSAGGKYFIWHINSENGDFAMRTFTIDYAMGVRPVIVVEKSNL